MLKTGTRGDPNKGMVEMGTKTILVVDDNERIVDLYARMLRKLNLTVEKAFNGMMALDVVRMRKVDFIIMDFDMPYLNGIEALIEIKEIEPDVPVMIVSGEESSEIREKAIKAGAVDYLMKPVDLALIREYIIKLLDL